MKKDFHRLCDGKGPTLSLFKEKETGQCIGGFTNAQWSAPDEPIGVADPGAVVFNLTHQTAFQVINTKPAIACGKNRGPVFNGTLGALNEPFNGNNNCVSGYEYGYYESRVVDGFDRLIQRKTD